MACNHISLATQVRLFGSRDLSKAMLAEDIWATVASSTELVPLARRTSDYRLTAPASGTALWADLWTVPAGANGGSHLTGPSPLLPALFEYVLMPNRLLHKKGLQSGPSPLQLPELISSTVLAHQHLPIPEGSNVLNHDELPAHHILRRSEFLHPLDTDTSALYADLLTF